MYSGAIEVDEPIPADATMHVDGTLHADATMHVYATLHADATMHVDATLHADAKRHHGALLHEDAITAETSFLSKSDLYPTDIVLIAAATDGTSADVPASTSSLPTTSVIQDVLD